MRRFFTILFVFGCGLPGCIGELKAAGADQANPAQLVGGALPLATITLLCEQSTDSLTCTAETSSGDAQTEAQKDSIDSQDGAAQ